MGASGSTLPKLMRQSKMQVKWLDVPERKHQITWLPALSFTRKSIPLLNQYRDLFFAVFTPIGIRQTTPGMSGWLQTKTTEQPCNEDAVFCTLSSEEASTQHKLWHLAAIQHGVLCAAGNCFVLLTYPDSCCLKSTFDHVRPKFSPGSCSCRLWCGIFCIRGALTQQFQLCFGEEEVFKGPMQPPKWLRRGMCQQCQWMPDEVYWYVLSKKSG